MHSLTDLPPHLRLIIHLDSLDDIPIIPALCWLDMVKYASVPLGEPVQPQCWLVVSTPLKNISQFGWLFPIYRRFKMFQTTNPNVSGLNPSPPGAPPLRGLWRLRGVGPAVAMDS